MQKAIITGSTGLIGKTVAKYLSDQGVEVLCLGRRNLNRQDIQNIFGRSLTYLPIPMETIEQLPEALESIGWNNNYETVFYHFAWKGVEKLTDGTFEDQLKNAILSANAVKAAKKTGCLKFINSGTLEETFIESFLNNQTQTLHSRAQTNYALAKIASRDLCKIVAYLEKIDYIHTRLSVPLDVELSMGTYVVNTLNKIRNKDPYDLPTNHNYFDIIPLDELAKAYKLIAEFGINKADYFIGTGQPITLHDFFEGFRTFIIDNKIIDSTTVPLKTKDIFSIEILKKDIGFNPKTFFQSFKKSQSESIEKLNIQNSI
jgi:nucleoside-diphosphate-sugar epimerase